MAERKFNRKIFNNKNKKKTISRVFYVFVIVFFLFLLVAAFYSSALAREKNQDKGKNITDKVKRVFNGFSFGAHERLLPYLSLEDWFDPYVGLKLKHCVLGSANVSMAHHVKFETVRDFFGN